MFKKSLYTTLPILRADECWDLPTQYSRSLRGMKIEIILSCMLVNFKIRSLICVAWEYDNDRRYSERNRVQNKIFYLQFVASRNCLVSSCRIPKKNYSNVSLHLPLNSDQDSPFEDKWKLNTPKNTQFGK